MKRVRTPRGLLGPALVGCAALGFAAGWIVRGHPPEPVRSIAADLPLRSPRPSPAPAEAPAAVAPAPERSAPGTAGTSGGDGSAAGASAPAVEALQQKDLGLPIDGADVSRWKGQFTEPRGDGGRRHEAVDILAPRNTPVHAVDDGKIAKLFFSKGGGGNTIYQFDPTKRFCYYYAHLEKYAEALHEGQAVSRGDVIGFVGTSGDAPPDTPHLHFAIFELAPERQWWKGTPIDPYDVYNR